MRPWRLCCRSLRSSLGLLSGQVNQQLVPHATPSALSESHMRLNGHLHRFLRPVSSTLGDGFALLCDRRLSGCSRHEQSVSIGAQISGKQAV